MNGQPVVHGSAGLRSVRARAPLRLGFAGGGTDLSPFCDQHGGLVLNAAVALYAYVHLRPSHDNKIRFFASELEQAWESEAIAKVPLGVDALLHRGVYNRIVAEFNRGVPLPVSIRTTVDVPPGSGMGGSSTLVVALIEAFRQYLQLPLGEYDIARMAVEIERYELGLAGGRQDQYAAAFGGFNFMEFGSEDRVIVNPLRMNSTTVRELEASLLLYFTGQSRDSANIIIQQQQEMAAPNSSRAFESLKALKNEAIRMKEAMLTGDLQRVADSLNQSWLMKRATASGVSTQNIDRLLKIAFENGAKAGKVSGAGGGGFIILVAEPEERNRLAQRLALEHGKVLTCSFSPCGAESWEARV
jgi:D-glycero-alpha-D-manno-heptose-7-phosphate kinase